LGVKFRSDVAGFVTGIRFWKPSTVSGTHVGHLWTASGAQLGAVTFTGESASGWQDATFGAPIAIDADTTYIASSLAPNDYAASGGSFAGSGVDSPPLHALADGVDGANGVYVYGPSGGFPDQTYNATNYWVDVVFATSVGLDTTPPTVISTVPGVSGNGVSTTANVSAAFSEPLDPTTVSSSTFELQDAANALVPGTLSYVSGTRTAVFDPSATLVPSTTYSATIKGGLGGVTDVAGNPLASDKTWTFTTAAPPPPPPNEGLGGPILVVASTANPFSRYYAEILRNEGLN